MGGKFERPESGIRTQRAGIRARLDSLAKLRRGLADQIVVAERAKRRVALQSGRAGGKKRFGVRNGLSFVEEIRRGVNGDKLQMRPGEVRDLPECGGEQLDGLRRVSAKKSCAVKIRDVAIIGPPMVQGLVLGDYFDVVRRSVGHAGDVRALNEDVAGIALHKGANGGAARLKEIVLGLIRCLVAGNLVERRLYV